LALLALAVLIVSGVATIALFMLMQPTAHLPRGWLGARSRLARLGAAGTLFLVAATTVAVDRNFYEGGYSIAHLFLEVAGLWCVFLAISLLPTRRHQCSRAFGLRYLAGVLGLFFCTAMTLSPKRTGELSVMLGRPYAALALETWRGLLDFDQDGYSSLLGGGDCEPFSSSVNPAKAEIAGNGLDDNCRLGDAPVIVDAPSEMSVPADPSPVSVVLITVDTLAAPYMSLYGGKKKTTPGIDAWAKRAAVFEHAYTTGGWTSLAISSMMRGVYPRHLKWTRLFETTSWRLLTADQLKTLPKGETVKGMFGLPIDDPRTTIPTWLSMRGMATSAVVNDGQSEFLDPVFQKEGFDQFVDMDTRAARGQRPTDREVTQMANNPDYDF
jgi:hypothetical protein